METFNVVLKDGRGARFGRSGTTLPMPLGKMLVLILGLMVCRFIFAFFQIARLTLVAFAGLFVGQASGG